MNITGGCLFFYFFFVNEPFMIKSKPPEGNLISSLGNANCIEEYFSKKYKFFIACILMQVMKVPLDARNCN